jgi:hypothetical protein
LFQLRSLLYHKSRLFLDRENDDLRFVRKPAKIGEQPAPLDPAYSGNRELLLFSAWILANIDTLRHGGCGDIDKLKGLRCDVEKDFVNTQERVNQVVASAWIKEMIREGLYGGIGGTDEPKLVSTSKLLFSEMNRG